MIEEAVFDRDYWKTVVKNCISKLKWEQLHKIDNDDDHDDG